MHSHSQSVSDHHLRRRKWLRLGIATLTSSALVGSSFVSVQSTSFQNHSFVAQAGAQEADPQVERSSAEGLLIDLRAFEPYVHEVDRGRFNSLVSAVHAQQSWSASPDDNQPSETSELDLTAIGVINLNLNGITSH